MLITHSTSKDNRRIKTNELSLTIITPPSTHFSSQSACFSSQMFIVSSRWDETLLTDTQRQRKLPDAHTENKQEQGMIRHAERQTLPPTQGHIIKWDSADFFFHICFHFWLMFPDNLQHKYTTDNILRWQMHDNLCYLFHLCIHPAVFFMHFNSIQISNNKKKKYRNMRNPTPC